MQTMMSLPDPQQNSTPPQTLDWLKVGQSFVQTTPSTSNPPPKRKNIPNYLGEDLIEQSKKFFNVDKRKSAADYIDEDFSCEEDSKMNDQPSHSQQPQKNKIDNQKKVFFFFLLMKKRFFAKKIKKKKKPKKSALKKPERGSEKRIEEVPDLRKADFLYKHKLKSHLYPISIMRFGVEDNYTYGLKIHEVPKFRRIKR